MPVAAIRQFGSVPYAEALYLQQDAIAGRKKKTIPDTLILLEHPPTYTLGLRGKESHFRVPVNLLCQKGIAVFRADRGGDVTFHGPGQLVGYPIIDIAARGYDIRQYVRQLEDMIIDVLAACYIDARHLSGYPGVWAGEKKIAAIGIKVNAAGIASHGFALNVNTDLACFEKIIPCGLGHKSVTSMAEVLKRPVPMGQVRTLLSEAFMRVFG
ncbi:MAG: lipoyl(octanoyl) transferase LipB [Desulfosalsimonadaceae bacterium]